MYMCARGIKPGQCERSCICALGVLNQCERSCICALGVLNQDSVSGHVYVR